MRKKNSSVVTPHSEDEEKEPIETEQASPTSVTLVGVDQFFSPDVDVTTREKWVKTANDKTNDMDWESGSNKKIMLTVQDVKIGEKKIEISLLATRITANGKSSSFDIHLTRTDEEKLIDGENKSVSTWRCQTLDSGFDEPMQFKFIAAESLQLRLASGMTESEARRVGIVELSESERGERKIACSIARFPFDIASRPQGASEEKMFSQKEIELIQAHFDAGYKEVYYGGLMLTPKATSATYLPLSIQQPPFVTKLVEIYLSMVNADSAEKKEEVLTKLAEWVSELAEKFDIKNSADELINKMEPFMEEAQQQLNADARKKLTPIIDGIYNNKDETWMSVYDTFDSESQVNITAAVVASASIMIPSLLKPGV